MSAVNTVDTAGRVAWIVSFAYSKLKIVQVRVDGETDLSYILQCNNDLTPVLSYVIGRSAYVRRVTPKGSLIYFTYAQAVKQGLHFLRHRIPVLRAELEELEALQIELSQSQT